MEGQKSKIPIYIFILKVREPYFLISSHHLLLLSLPFPGNLKLHPWLSYSLSLSNTNRSLTFHNRFHFLPWLPTPQRRWRFPSPLRCWASSINGDSCLNRGGLANGGDSSILVIPGDRSMEKDGGDALR